VIAFQLCFSGRTSVTKDSFPLDEIPRIAPSHQWPEFHTRVPQASFPQRTGFFLRFGFPPLFLYLPFSFPETTPDARDQVSFSFFGTVSRIDLLFHFAIPRLFLLYGISGDFVVRVVLFCFSISSRPLPPWFFPFPVPKNTPPLLPPPLGLVPPIRFCRTSPAEVPSHTLSRYDRNLLLTLSWIVLFSFSPEFFPPPPQETRVLQFLSEPAFSAHDAPLFSSSGFVLSWMMPSFSGPFFVPTSFDRRVAGQGARS